MPKRGENIYKRKDGRWEGRVKVNGQVKYKYFYGKTYSIVKEKLNIFKNENSTIPITSDKTVSELFKEWLNVVKIKVKSSTFYNYKMKVEKHIIPIFGKMRYSTLEVTLISQFIYQKISSGLSVGYVSDILSVFKSMAKYINRIYGYKDIVSTVSIPKNNKNEPQLLTDEQQKILFNTLLENFNETSLCIIISLFTGIRIGEICCLSWEDINFETNTIHITKTVQRINDIDTSSTKLIIDIPKSKTSKRIIPIPAFLSELMKKYKCDNYAYVLSGSKKITEPRTLQRRFKSILRKAGLPDIHYHSLRHMFATNCIKIGFDIKTLSEILGHSSVEITLNRYVHSSMAQKVEYMNMINPTI